MPRRFSHYVGSPYTTVSGPYDTSMRLEMTFELATPLLPNLVESDERESVPLRLAGS